MDNLDKINTYLKNSKEEYNKLLASYLMKHLEATISGTADNAKNLVFHKFMVCKNVEDLTDVIADLKSDYVTIMTTCNVNPDYKKRILLYQIISESFFQKTENIQKFIKDRTSYSNIVIFLNQFDDFDKMDYSTIEKIYNRIKSSI